LREALRRRLARRSGADDGMSLVELMVAMLIFSVVMAVSFSVLASVQRQSSDVQAREDTVGNARLATEQMDRQIRSGNVLYDPQAENYHNPAHPSVVQPSMRVYTQANGTQQCVQWYVDTYTDTLQFRSWSPTWQTDGIVSGWSVVAHYILNDASTPPFSLQGSTTPYGSRLLDISLLVQAPKAKGNPIQVQTSLSGRNTLYGYDPGVCSPVPAG
jgi:prepilin-type N-terminal cleavage/methylation domain-containing protein